VISVSPNFHQSLGTGQRGRAFRYRQEAMLDFAGAVLGAAAADYERAPAVLAARPGGAGVADHLVGPVHIDGLLEAPVQHRR
jgi:hypothetical protein